MIVQFTAPQIPVNNQFCHAHHGVMAPLHQRRTTVISHAVADDAIPKDAGNARNNTHRKLSGSKLRPLLDMGLEIAFDASKIAPRRSHLFPSFAKGMQCIFHMGRFGIKPACEDAASKKRSQGVELLAVKGINLHWMTENHALFLSTAKRCKSRCDTHGAVIETAGRHSVKMGSQDNRRKTGNGA